MYVLGGRMSRSSKSISEVILATNLNELAHTFVRELAMACRKVSIYGSDHPTGAKAVEKPFFVLDNIFRLRNHANLNLDGGILYALNIRLKQSLFTDEIVRYMQVLETGAVLFDRRVTMQELAAFIGRLVQRVDLSDHRNLLSNYLEENNITAIEVDSERAFKLFESQKKYRGDACGDFSVGSLALQQLGDKLEALADVNRRGQEALDDQGIDFTLDIINYLLPEKFAALSAEVIVETLTDLANQMHTLQDNNQKRTTLLDSYKSLYSLIDYHPRRDHVISELEQYLSSNKLPAEVAQELSTPVGAIRVASSERIDNLLQQLFLPGNEGYDVEEYRHAFRRLLKTGQRAKATEVVLNLIGLLAGPDGTARQRALELLECSITSLDLVADVDVAVAAVDRVIADLAKKRETYEYSEVIWCLLGRCLETRRFDLMAKLTSAMAQRRQSDGNVTLYDSMAVKKAFESLNQRRVIEILIDNMIKGDHETSRYVREILISTGSEEVAAALSCIISHPIRQVRQQSLKVLAELGKASVKVFSRILMDDTMFERESGRYELPDGKWYMVRNSIFVLGLLGDEEGITLLRLRMGDSDIRVRREIVTALEKIGGEEACDLLILMADDPIKEIRESAVIAVGLIGTPEMVPQLLDLARRNPLVAVRALSALGKIGGEEARSFLARLMEDDKELSGLASDKVSKEDLRLTAIRSLANIGDDKSIATIKDYRDNLSAAQKIFFKNSPINRAIAEILSRH